MKRISFPTLLGLLVVLGCDDQSDVTFPTTYTEQSATLRVVACSRGCEQYVLYLNDATPGSLYVMNMPDSLKIRAVPAAYVNNELAVVFSGERPGGTEQVSIADANDVPQPAYKAHRLQLTALRRR